MVIRPLKMYAIENSAARDTFHLLSALRQG